MIKKYIRAFICITYSFIKFSILKIFHLQGFKFHFLQLFSPFVDIEIGKNGELGLGKLVKVRSGSKIRVRKDAKVFIDDNTSLNHSCMLISHEKIIIGKGVQFGPNVLIYDHDHDFRQKDGLKNLKYKTSPVEIGDNVWIGANVIVLRGTKIGNNCVIGAGTVVKGEFPDNTVIVQKKENIIKSY